MKFRQIKLNRTLLLLIGLWPYQRSKLAQFQCILFLVILTTFIVFQFETFLTSRLTMDFVLKTLFSAFLITTAMIIYISFYVNIKNVKILLNRIQHTYDELKDENEIAIIDKYWNNAKRYIFTITMFIIFALSWITSLQLWPCILDTIRPINKTRPFPQIEIITEYIDDRGKYFYLFLLHANAVIGVAIFGVLGTGAMLFAYCEHICGMFSIASYRIQFAVSMLQHTSKKENLICEGIIYAVDIHRKAMQFSEDFITKFELWFAFMIVFGVLSLTFNLLRMFQKISAGFNIGEIVILFLSLAVHFLYMFFANYIAQEITDHNNHVFGTVYNVRWYITPLHIQKMILFLLQRGTKPFNLNLGGIFVGSLEGFATLLSYSISYFTVIYSMRR